MADLLQVADFRSCPPLRPRTSLPTSVRDLRPDDFDVIIGIGDSLMTGLNSRIPHTLPAGNIPTHKGPEFRGGNFITGADADATSVGQILSHYNPSICGLSKGNTSLIFCYGPICAAGTKAVPFEPESTGLNAAQSGSWTTLHNTFNQLRYLDIYLDQFTPPSIVNPWKLMFIELGFNNVCLGCANWSKNLEFSGDHYEFQIRGLLEAIRARYSKVFITIMGPFNVSQVCYSTLSNTQLHDVIDNFSDCRAKRKSIIGCVCNDRPQMFNNSRLHMDLLSMDYNKRLRLIASDYQAKNYSDFTVVYDPGLGTLDFRNGSIDMISGADCFHPSQQSHNRAGVSVWNNLFRKDADKIPMNIKTPNAVFCPDEDMRLWSG